MSKFKFNITMSLDGYIAGPNQSLENPLGEGGEQLHEWALELKTFRETHGEAGGETGTNDDVLREMFANVGATIMGRNMFGGGPGPWGDAAWKGWWGDNPPYHTPVFVLTHHPREPLVMQGGTTFIFVTDGIESALRQAREAAGGTDILIGGGATVAQQYLAAGLLDEVEIHVVPLLLGGGERLFDNLQGSGVKLEPIRSVEGPGVTHLKYRVVNESTNGAEQRAGYATKSSGG
jgi:dihydrofolate reductase